MNSIGFVLSVCGDSLGERILNSGAARGGPINTVRMQNKITALVMVLYCFGLMFSLILIV